MKPKRLPRLWCALQGLLPFEACVVAQHGELAWPGGPEVVVVVATNEGERAAKSRKRNGDMRRARSGRGREET